MTPAQQLEQRNVFLIEKSQAIPSTRRTLLDYVRAKHKAAVVEAFPRHLAMEGKLLISVINQTAVSARA